MSVQYSEELTTYSCELTPESDVWKQHLSDFLESVSHDVESRKEVYIYHLGEQESSFQLDILSESKIEACLQTLTSIEPDSSNIRVKLVVNKCSPARVLQIYSPRDFVSRLESKKTLAQFKFVYVELRNNYDKVYVAGNPIDISTAINAEGDKYLLANKVRAFDDVFELKNSSLEYIEDLLYLLSFESHLSDYFLKLRTISSLAILSRKCSVDKLQFFFDGDKQISLSNRDIKFYHSYGQVIYDFYRWGLSDERYRTRISIINHVFAQYQDIEQSFKPHLFDVLESNYKVYISDNFEQYVEVTSKLSDFLYETTAKIGDKISDSIASARNILILTLSYFFTIIVFTGIDKGRVENVFNFEISMLSTLFIVGGLVNLYWLRNEIVANTELAKMQLNEMINRYSVYIGDGELSDIKYCPSLELVSNKANQYRVYLSYGVVLCSLLFLVWYLYSLKTPLPFLDAISTDMTKAKDTISK